MVRGSAVDRCGSQQGNGWFCMSGFNRKVDEASARVNRRVAQAADRLEKETEDFIAYLNQEVVPAIRQHSTKVLRVTAKKMSRLADYLEENQSRS